MEQTGWDEDMEMMLVAVKSYSYRLRMAVCLLDQLTTELAFAGDRRVMYVEQLLKDMLESAEDATTSLQKLKDQPAAPEADLGAELLRGDG